MRDFSAGLTVEFATVEPLEFRCCKGYSLSHMPPPGSWSACRIAHRAARGCYETVRLVRYEITGQKVLRNYETLQSTDLTDLCHIENYNFSPIHLIKKECYNAFSLKMRIKNGFDFVY